MAEGGREAERGEKAGWEYVYAVSKREQIDPGQGKLNIVSC